MGQQHCFPYIYSTSLHRTSTYLHVVLIPIRNPSQRSTPGVANHEQDFQTPRPHPYSCISPPHLDLDLDCSASDFAIRS